MFSSIRLGDGPLSVYDLYELRLSAELVTLSGCGTGLSVVVGGDEQLGLVRGLLYAGARAVLLTLWDAYDSSTADFMKAFYGRLQEGWSKARAAQEGMRELRERYPHPFYWAPFALIGNVEACLTPRERRADGTKYSVHAYISEAGPHPLVPDDTVPASRIIADRSRASRTSRNS